MMHTITCLILLLFVSFVLAQPESISDCFEPESVEFIWVDGNEDFDGAIEACTQLVPPATLASIQTPATQSFVSDFLIANGPGTADSEPWFGMKRLSVAELPFGEDLTNPDLFTFIDGTIIGSLDNGEFPWRVGIPNGNDNGERECAL